MVSQATQIIVATLVGPLFVGLFMWYLKRQVDSFFTNLNSKFDQVDTLDRVVQGTSNRNGILDVVESHDTELERSDALRQHTLTRLRLLEQRVDRLARRAESRSTLADESDYHRRQAEQIADQGRTRADMDDINGDEASPSQSD